MYDEIAGYYDLLHSGMRADIDFALELAEKGCGPILELGCGTGRLVIPLVLAGHTVTGLDNSAEMLSLANHKLSGLATRLRERVRLVSGDIRRFELDGQFALIIISHNTFMHLDYEGARESLRCAREHLKPEGWLFIDASNPLNILNSSMSSVLELEREVFNRDTGETVRLFSRSQTTDSVQELNVTWTYEIEPADGGAVSQLEFDSTFHYFLPHQMDLLLSSAGFHLDRLYGDYERGAFQEDSTHMLVLARPTTS